MILILISVLAIAFLTYNKNDNLSEIKKIINSDFESSVFTLFKLEKDDIKIIYSTSINKNKATVDNNQDDIQFIDLLKEVTNLNKIRSGYSNEIFSQEYDYLGVSIIIEYKSNSYENNREKFILYINKSNNNIIIQNDTENFEYLPKDSIYDEYESNNTINNIINKRLND